MSQFEYLERKIKKFASALASKETRNVFNHVALASQVNAYFYCKIC